MSDELPPLVTVSVTVDVSVTVSVTVVGFRDEDRPCLAECRHRHDRPAVAARQLADQRRVAVLDHRGPPARPSRRTIVVAPPTVVRTTGCCTVAPSQPLVLQRDRASAAPGRGMRPRLHPHRESGEQQRQQRHADQERPDRMVETTVIPRVTHAVTLADGVRPATSPLAVAGLAHPRSALHDPPHGEHPRKSPHTRRRNDRCHRRRRFSCRGLHHRVTPSSMNLSITG